jgi:transposase
MPRTIEPCGSLIASAPNKKLSNKQFKNRHDPEAKISRQKGKTDLVYKPENSVDMESGTIIQAQLVAGDQCDSVELPQRVQLVQQVLQQLRPKQKLKAVVADSNYHSLANVCALQQAGFKVLIADSNAPKRQEHLLEPSQRQALQKARQDLQSKSGRLFMRLRGQHIERSFAHILDCGGMRKATLRGQLNLQKRYVFAAACYNLSQLLRARFGCGTLRMTLASRLGLLSSFVLRLKWLPNLLFGNATRHPLLRLLLLFAPFVFQPLKHRESPFFDSLLS